ncbi:MAG: TlyA family RNA methyltransferase [Pseudoclavibacter sp.]
MSETQRLDQALTARGLARSRTHASRLIEAGGVLMNGAPAGKPSARVRATDALEVTGEHPEHHYVSRAAFKLIAGLDAFGIDPRGRPCLDVGASTGGFTQVLLERGARHVVALDVGHDQLADEVAREPAVTVLEGVNARDLDADELDGLIRRAAPPRPSSVPAVPAVPAVTSDARTPALRASDLDLVVADLSFISLCHVLEPMRRSVAAGADFVLLIKPQFEVGRQGVRGGIVTDPRLATQAILRVVQQAHDIGLGTLGFIASPITGTHGNREYVAHFATRGEHPTQWSELITEITGGERTRGAST